MRREREYEDESRSLIRRAEGDREIVARYLLLLNVAFPLFSPSSFDFEIKFIWTFFLSLSRENGSRKEMLF